MSVWAAVTVFFLWITEITAIFKSRCFQNGAELSFETSSPNKMKPVFGHNSVSNTQILQFSFVRQLTQGPNWTLPYHVFNIWIMCWVIATHSKEGKLWLRGCYCKMRWLISLIYSTVRITEVSIWLRFTEPSVMRATSPFSQGGWGLTLRFYMINYYVMFILLVAVWHTYCKKKQIKYRKQHIYSSLLRLCFWQFILFLCSYLALDSLCSYHKISQWTRCFNGEGKRSCSVTSLYGLSRLDILITF